MGIGTKRNQLLSSASVLCYTPHREHFGIVPLEAMDSGIPVVAIRSGGPMETIVNGVTGYLVEYSGSETESTSTVTDEGTANSKMVNPTIQGFADAIANIISNPKKAHSMGQNGKKRVDNVFGMETFRKQWWELLAEAQTRGKERHYNQTVGQRYCVSFSVMRSFCELAMAILLAVSLTWVMGRIGLLEQDLGVAGTAKVYYQRWLSGSDEL